MSQIIIEFAADLSSLKPAIDALVAIGAIDKKVADEFKRNNAAFAERQKLLKDQKEAATQAGSGIDALAKRWKELTTTVASGALSEGADQLNESVGKTASHAVSLKSELRQVTAQLAQMKLEGKENTTEFQNLLTRAGHLDDTLKDARQSIANMGNDTRVFQGLIEGASGLVGVFSAAQGTAALFGEESEDVQKTLVKLNAAMAVLNGLQQIQVLVQKESAASMLVMGTAQKVYNIVVGESTGLLKGFKIALAATGIGFVLIALAALVTNFKAVKDVVLDIIPGLKNLGGLFDEIKKRFFGFISGFVESLKVVGGLLADFFSGDIFGLVEDAKAAGARIAKAYHDGYKAEDGKQQQDRLRELTEHAIEEGNRRIALLEAQGKDTFAARKKLLEQELSLLEQGSKEFLDKQNEINVLVAAQQKAANDRAIESARDRADQLKQLQEDVSKAKVDVQEAALPDNEREIQHAKAKYDALRAEAKAFNAITIAEQQAKDQALLDIEDAFQTELAQIRKRQFQTTSEAEYAAALKSTEAFYDNLKRIEKERLATGVVDQEKYNDTINELDQQLFQAKANVATDYVQSVETASNDVVEFQSQADDKALDNHIAHNEKVVEDDKKKAEKQMELAQKVAEYESRLKEQGLEFARNLSQIGYNWEVSALNRALEQKKISQEQFDKRIKEAQRSAAIRQKGTNAFSIVVDTAATIMKTGKELGYPAAIPFQIIAGAEGAAQLGVVLSTPLPAFWKGSKSVPRGNNRSGVDTVPALLTEKEAVIPVSENADYSTTVSAIIDRTIPAQVLNRFVSNYSQTNFSIGDMPQLAKLYWESHTMPDFTVFNTIAQHSSNEQQAGLELDPAELAQHIGEEIKQHPRVQLNMDRDGFSTYIMENGHRVKSLDKRYSFNG